MTNSADHGGPTQALSQPLYGASMGQAVSRFFKKYTRFKGYASRSEYWWVAFFSFIVTSIVSIPYYMNLAGADISGALVLLSSFAMLLWALATLIPMLAVAWRRLHDAGFPGPLYLLILIPFIGPIIVLVLLVLPTRPERHQAIWADPAVD